MASFKDKVVRLYKAAGVLSNFSLSWCSVERQKTFQRPLLENVAVGSEEHRQLIRLHLHVDDLALGIASNLTLVETDLDLSTCIHLYWSLAIIGKFDLDLIKTIQHRVQWFLSNGSGMTPSESVELLFAEAVLFHHDSAMDLDFGEKEFASFPLEMRLNVLFSLSLISRNSQLITKLRKHILNDALSSTNKKIAPDVVPYLVRTVIFAANAVGEDPHHDSAKLKSAFPDISKTVPLPPWAYAFQLSLACHAVASRGVELSPIVESVFATDVLFVPPGGKKKLLLEIVRPSSLIREIRGGAVCGLDGYTRLSRLILSSKGYRIICITVTEWVKLSADKDEQKQYVKRRIRNCLQKKRLYTGTERDELLHDKSDSSSDDNDMSD